MTSGAAGSPVYGEAEVLEVAVPVATMWTSPDAPRDIDQPAVQDVPDAAAWTGSMDAVVRKGLVGRTLTQLLLGEPVHVLEHAGEWVRVAALWQPSSAHPSGYPGWVRRAHLAPPVVPAATRAVVVVPRADAVLADGRRLQLSFGTSLAVDDSLASATGLAHEQPVRVRVPGTADGGPERGAALAAGLRPGDVRLLSAEPHPAPAAQVVLGSAGMFLGLRYLWGGNSAWGLDCSGLVHLTYRAHGVVVPRDAFDQADLLPGVDLGAVEPGDLYFFARPGEKVYHVGFVSRPVAADGVRRMLHAPEGGELIEEAPLAPHRVETLVSAGRVQGR
ncbi:MAG TPA: NlpC/P60 family protein [Nocardioidaceae bacterium]|nr:NlpC/P60 family protein [Nocardioidaceae bacterium]